MNESIFKSIKNLPPLDDTITQIQQICHDENANMSDLIAVIKRDPMLTANILHSANSPLYGFSREISDVSQAVNLFGMATIRGFALYGAIKHSFKMDLSPYNIDGTKFLDIVSTQSILIFDWYAKANRSALNVLSPSSFLMEIGKIVVAKELIESKKADEFKSKLANINTIEELSQLESQLVGSNSEEITAQILEQWHFEEEIVQSIKYLNKISQAPKEIKNYAIALNAAKTSVNVLNKFKPENIQSALNFVEKNGLDKDKFALALKKVQEA